MPARIRAFLIHLGGSAIVALLAAALVFVVWYPSPLAIAVGLTSLFAMMLAVDVVIGPLLTLLVYKVGKKSLRTDLTIIVVLQIAALAYGLWSIAQARPAWIVFNKDRFDIGQANELDRRLEAEARAEFRAVSWTGPRWVASVAPKESEKYNELLMEVMQGGPDLPQRIDLYRPLSENADAIRGRLRDLSELGRFNDAAAVAAVTARWPQADAFVPLMAKAKPMTVLMRKADASVVAIVNLNPWPE